MVAHHQPVVFVHKKARSADDVLVEDGSFAPVSETWIIHETTDVPTIPGLIRQMVRAIDCQLPWKLYVAERCDDLGAPNIETLVVAETAYQASDRGIVHGKFDAQHHVVRTAAGHFDLTGASVTALGGKR